MSSADIPLDKVLAKDNVELPAGAASGVGNLMLGGGLVLVFLTWLGGWMGDEAAAKVALSAYHVGFLLTVGLTVVSMGFVMILHQTNAGWAATIRRQFENIMSLVWLPALLFFLGTVYQWVLLPPKGDPAHAIYLFSWMDSAYTAGDPIYQKKAAYLNIPFFYIRALVYFVIWGLFAFALMSFSTKQDLNGDKWETAKARKVSAVGLLFFAFTIAFASFDWVMSLDFHWFSTMLPVWFFAGGMLSALAVGTLALLLLRYFGRLHVAFTNEHLHDLGKLLFAFTVFWAYISFSQYFLIWYASIPEETAFFIRRREPGTLWGALSWVIPIGHFIVPFILLMARPARRTGLLIGFVCVWLILMHVLDVYWFVRPQAIADHHPVGFSWMDITGAFGPLLLFFGLLIKKIGRLPLIPIRDPRLPEALHHKNYV